LVRATVSITLNATAVAKGDVVIDVDAGTGNTSTSVANLNPAKVIGVSAIAAALDVDEGRVRGLAAFRDGTGHLTLTFSLVQPSVDAINASNPEHGRVATEIATTLSATAVINTSGFQSSAGSPKTAPSMATNTSNPMPSESPTTVVTVPTAVGRISQVGLSDATVIGRLVLTLRPWVSQVTVQRDAGSSA
jgi:hypothetical protein